MTGRSGALGLGRLGLRPTYPLEPSWYRLVDLDGEEDGGP